MELEPKELSKYVSIYIGSYNKQPIYFEKKIIIKDDNLESLEGRITELLRFEDTKRVIFGVFSLSEDASRIIQMFQSKAKQFIKEAGRKKALGRIWCIEINGTTRGCGIIAADDAIRIWKDI
jgi:hypothetical protein